MTESWPPELTELKSDMSIRVEETRDDDRLQLVLDAAVAFVERAHAGAFSFGDPFSDLPEVPADMVLGTLRLAGRWHTRRRSPDGLVTAGPDLGNSRVPAVDADIARLLRVDRFRGSVVA